MWEDSDGWLMGNDGLERGKESEWRAGSPQDRQEGSILKSEPKYEGGAFRWFHTTF